jgi:hypothetical protein
MRALKSIAWLMVALAVLALPWPLHAQEPRPNSVPPAPPAAPPPDAEKPDATKPDAPKSIDELVGELLTSPDGDDDLAWLYSDQDYEPSDLVGTPIAAPALPRRGAGAPREWDPTWRRFGLADYILTGSALTISLAGALVPRRTQAWGGRNGFDESVRDTLSIEGYEGGQWARDLSDVLVSTNITFPLLVDALIVTYWYRDSPDVAGQMALISAEALSVAAALQGVTAGLSHRQRPYVRNCGGELEAELDDCQGTKPQRSFFSGHTAMAFAGAGVTCTLHARHDVFGTTTADTIACGAALLSAATVGTMRVVGDQHYASDVLVGMVVGLASGLGVPWALHYGGAGEAPGALAGARREWRLALRGSLLSIEGRF